MYGAFTQGWVVIDAVSQAWKLLQCLVVQILLLDAWGQYWPPCCHPCPRGAFFPNKQTTQNTNLSQLRSNKHHHYKYPATPSETNPHQNCNHLLRNTQNSHNHAPKKNRQATAGQAQKPTDLTPQKKPPHSAHSTQTHSKLHLLKLTEAKQHGPSPRGYAPMNRLEGKPWAQLE